MPDQGDPVTCSKCGREVKVGSTCNENVCPHTRFYDGGTLTITAIIRAHA
jgi:hypothetical protein